MNMHRYPRFRSLRVVMLGLALAACAPLTQYRTNYALCATPLPVSETCERHSLQRVTDPEHASPGYYLSFVEFDDQGQLFDRRQMQAAVDQLSEVAAKEDLLMVVFVHGWKHSAAPGDDNVETFRGVLRQLAIAERGLSQLTNKPPRQIAGVYVGWRGGSITVPVLKELTFWERKNTAHIVGHIGVTEMLSRLEAIKNDRDSMSPDGSRTRFVIVGHSFGGAVVNAALGQILQREFVRTRGPAGQRTGIGGVGNLVVLINPAFEALRFAPQSDMSAERGTYFPEQLPVLAVLTSEADWATKYAFSAGRWFSTFFEKEQEISRWNAVLKQEQKIAEQQANRAAVGHFEPYRTHRLYPGNTNNPAQAMTADASAQATLRTSAAWANDQPGSKLEIADLVLERTMDSAARNPYLMIYVDKSLIKDHNDIAEPRVVSFLQQLILMSSHTQEQRKSSTDAK